MNQLPGLLQRSGARFTEVYADAGYFSRKNCWEIGMRGATPFIRPKKTTHAADEKRTPFNDMVRSYLKDPKTCSVATTDEAASRAPSVPSNDGSVDACGDCMAT